MRCTRPALAAAVLCIAAATGCESGADTAPEATARDSAGVRIVENRKPMWREGDAWRIAETASASRVGTSLSWPAPSASTDGRIVIANQGDMSLRFYSADGGLQTSVGRPSSGPDEFMGMAAPFPLGHSIVVFDYNRRRLSILDGNGRVRRTLDDVPAAAQPAVNSISSTRSPPPGETSRTVPMPGQ